MKPLTDAEKLLMLYAAAANSGSKAPQDDVQKRIGIARATATALIKEGGNLKQPALRDRLNNAFGKLFVEPGCDEYRARYAEIKLALGETEDGRETTPNIRFLDRYVIALAYGPWADEALDSGLSDTERLLIGKPTYKVLSAWVKLKKHRLAQGVAFFKVVPDEKVAERAREVINALAPLMAKNSKTPPDGLFLSGSELARRNGYRVYRLGFDSDHTGLSMGPMTTPDRVKLLSDKYKNGLANDFEWVRTFRGSEIAWSYVPWSLAMHASDWRRSVDFAAVLFRNFPDILTKEGKVKAIVDDPDMWPAIAAIVEENHNGLDSLRAILNACRDDEKLSRMMNAVSKARPVIANGGSYLEALEAILEALASMANVEGERK